MVAVASPHRAEAFTACRALIDELKASVPIWKNQELASGGSEWVNSEWADAGTGIHEGAAPDTDGEPSAGA